MSEIQLATKLPCEGAIAYVAHPIATNDYTGTFEDHMLMIPQRCKDVFDTGFVPVAPYYLALQYLDDNKEDDRRAGIFLNQKYFERGFVDLLVLAHSFISGGMWEEIALAQQYEIPIVFLSDIFPFGKLIPAKVPLSEILP